MPVTARRKERKVKRLKNGAKVHDYYWTDRDERVVLCSWKDEFVTWRVDKEGNAYLGHYFETYRAAMMDFFERIGKKSSDFFPVKGESK